jgi:hypothetical protein
LRRIGEAHPLFTNRQLSHGVIIAGAMATGNFNLESLAKNWSRNGKSVNPA